RHLDAALDAQFAARRGLEVGPVGLDAAGRPVAGRVPPGRDAEVAVAVEGDVLRAGRHRLDLTGAPVGRAARVARAGRVAPVGGVDAAAGRAVEVVEEDLVPARRGWRGGGARRRRGGRGRRGREPEGADDGDERPPDAAGSARGAGCAGGVTHVGSPLGKRGGCGGSGLGKPGRSRAPGGSGARTPHLRALSGCRQCALRPLGRQEVSPRKSLWPGRVQVLNDANGGKRAAGVLAPARGAGSAGAVRVRASVPVPRPRLVPCAWAGRREAGRLGWPGGKGTDVKLTILGGGGFRVPLVYGALLGDRGEGRVTRVALHDVDSRRLHAIGRVLAAQASGVPDAPEVTTTTDLDGALRGAGFVFSAIRVGGLAGRPNDERVAVGIARKVAALAPDAWVINFTNPAGLVTEAMSRHLGDRVIGICDSPVGLGRRIARVLGADPARAWIDYAGLNHLGWVRGLRVDGRDQLPRLLADPGLLGSFEEGRLFGADWLRSLGAVPNEYLHYYYFHREAVRAHRTGPTRGAFLHDQQAGFYARVTDPDTPALELWNRTRAEREATYMAENRETAGAGEREEEDLSGGYEKVALALMRAIARDERTTLIL